MRQLATGVVVGVLIASFAVSAQPPRVDGRSGDSTGSRLFNGTLAATVTAAPIAASQEVTMVLVQNDPDNAVDVLCGGSSGQTIQIKPQQGITFHVTNLSLIQCKTVSGTGDVNYVAW